MKTLNNSTGMVARWQEELAALDFTVCHRPGTQNTNAVKTTRAFVLFLRISVSLGLF